MLWLVSGKPIPGPVLLEIPGWFILAQRALGHPITSELGISCGMAVGERCLRRLIDLTFDQTL